MDAANTPRLKESMKTATEWVSPFNALVLAMVTLLDICAPAFHGRYAKVLAACAAVAILALLHRFQLARRNLAPGRSGAAAVLRAFFAARKNQALVVLLTGLVVLWCATKASAAEDEGALAGALPPVRALQMTLARIDRKADTILEAVAPTDPAGLLAKHHYGLDAASKARAVESGDLNALRQYRALDEALPLSTPVFGQRVGSNLEQPIRDHNPRLGEVLDLLAPRPGDLDARQPLSFVQVQSLEVPDFAGLVRDARRRHPRAAPMLQSVQVRATPLVLALWSDNREAVAKLIALGARTDVGIDGGLVFPQTDGTIAAMRWVPVRSARDEARRLHIDLPSPTSPRERP